METKNIRRIVSCIAFPTASVFLLLFFVYGPPARSYENGNRSDGVHSRLPASFPNDAFAHVETIVGFGLRPAASKGENQTSRYVLNEFRDMGLPAVTEEFKFGTFEIENVQLRVGDYRCRPVALGFNPYDEIRFYRGTALVVNPLVEDSPRKGRNMPGGYLITTKKANHFQLIAQRPKLIIYVSELDLGHLESQEDLEFELTVEGAEVRRRSSNVVAVVGPQDASHEILLTAHLDSYRDSPGADDNASGLGVLIELARYFKSMEDGLKVRIRFAALGAEELGLVGARAYTAMHAQQLQNCILSLDIDQVGGPRGPNFAVLGGVSGLPVQGGGIPLPSGLEERALEGVTSNWRLVDKRILPIFAASNHPEWLEELVQQSADELSIVFNPTNNLGGNEYAFTMTGVVATAISSSGNITHSPGDVPEQVRPESLQKAGSLTAQIVLKLATSDIKRGSYFPVDSVGYSHEHSETEISRFAEAIATSNDPGWRSAILDKMTRAGIRYDLQQFESTERNGKALNL